MGHSDTERRFPVREVADLLGLDPCTIKVAFDGESGVLRFEGREIGRGKAKLAAANPAASELPKNLAQSTNIATEPHHTPDEVAKLWGTCSNTVRKIFKNEQGVLIWGTNESMHKRGRMIMRIPESVMRRVHDKYLTKNPAQILHRKAHLVK